MKAPPPRPEDCGSTRLRTSWMATAASAALPPAPRISRPAPGALRVAGGPPFGLARAKAGHTPADFRAKRRRYWTTAVLLAFYCVAAGRGAAAEWGTLSAGRGLWSKNGAAVTRCSLEPAQSDGGTRGPRRREFEANE